MQYLFITSFLSLLFCIVFSQVNNPTDIKICDGNRFKHRSQYALGRMTDLNLTFSQMKYNVGQVTYKDQTFRTYKINQTSITSTFLMLKQTAKVQGINRVRFTGGTLRINYKFKWHKKQLSSEISGEGQGQVVTDAVTFVKQLDIGEETKYLQWNLVSADPIQISNSLSLQKISPYKQADYQVINQMLNHLKSNQTTLKSNLIVTLNQNFTSTLKKVVHENNDTQSQPQRITYVYSDYHGEIQFLYDNIMLELTLVGGLDLLMSQTINQYKQFQCGDKVPNEPEDPSIYGGLQQFISHKFFMSNLKYALQNGFLDIVLSEQNWQSHAFQFFVGDLHQIMPSTKNYSSLDPLNGACKALDDKAFAFGRKSDQSYDIKVNFTCEITYNKTKILGIIILVNYEVVVELKADQLNFKIKGITGQPNFTQFQGYQIKNQDLVDFMVAETLTMAKNSLVLGSGYKVSVRKSPRIKVRDTYLLMYDSAVKGDNSKVKATS